MPRIDLMRFLLCSATASLALLFISKPAQAEGNCPLGEIPVNNGQDCAYLYTPGGVEYEIEQSRLRGEAAERLREEREFADRLSDLKLLGANLEEQKKLINDPKYQAYFNGVWDFFQNKNNAPGGSCGALFSKLDGLILLDGPSKDSPNARLMFFGKNIPRPKEEEKIKVTFTEGNNPPQTVQTKNYVAPGIEYGVISFALPKAEAALDLLEDVRSFDLSIEGKSVLKIEWNGGLAVRDKFRECEKARVKK